MGVGAAIGGIAGGILQSNSASKAADAQKDAAERQLAFEQQVYDDTTERFEPFYGAGTDFLDAYRYELLGGDVPVFGGEAPEIVEVPGRVGGAGIGNALANALNSGPGSNGGLWGVFDGKIDPFTKRARSGGATRHVGQGRFSVNGQMFNTREEAQAYADANRTGGHEYKGFQATPGYEYLLDEGQKAIEGSAAARGGVFSGATLKSLQGHRVGLANQTYDTFLNRLAAGAAQGQAAAGNMATAGANFASGTGNALANLGNAQAAGYIGQGNALTGAINGLSSAWGYMNPTSSNGVTIPRKLMNNVQSVL